MDPKWLQVGTSNLTVTCASCGLKGVILQATGGKEFKNVAGSYFCWKDICQEESKKVPVPAPGS